MGAVVKTTGCSTTEKRKVPVPLPVMGEVVPEVEVETDPAWARADAPCLSIQSQNPQNRCRADPRENPSLPGASMAPVHVAHVNPGSQASPSGHRVRYAQAVPGQPRPFRRDRSPRSPSSSCPSSSPKPAQVPQRGGGQSATALAQAALAHASSPHQGRQSPTWGVSMNVATILLQVRLGPQSLSSQQ